MNTGDVPRGDADEPGSEMYDICLQHGGIIATGHNHEYARSKTLAHVRPDAVVERGAPYHYPATASRLELLVLAEGAGFAFVNGLGGLDIRSMRRPAAHWSKTINAEHDGSTLEENSAALICDLGGITGDAARTPGIRTKDEFVAAYDLPSELTSRIDDFAAQIGRCVLKNTRGHVLDTFLLLSIVQVSAESTNADAPTVPTVESQPDRVSSVESLAAAPDNVQVESSPPNTVTKPTSDQLVQPLAVESSPSVPVDAVAVTDLLAAAIALSCLVGVIRWRRRAAKNRSQSEVLHYN